MSEFIIRAEEEGLLSVSPGAEVTVAAGEGGHPATLQGGLLGVLLVGRGEVVDGVLDHVSRVHGLLQAAGDALHRSTATCREGMKGYYRSRVRWEGDGEGERRVRRRQAMFTSCQT